jgi:hypothetical protein
VTLYLPPDQYLVWQALLDGVYDVRVYRRPSRQDQGELFIILPCGEHVAGHHYVSLARWTSAPDKLPGYSAREYWGRVAAVSAGENKPPVPIECWEAMW